MATKKTVYKATTEDDGIYIKELLRSKLNFSIKLVTKVKYHGDILLNGNHATVRAKLTSGDLVEIIYPEEESFFIPENIPLDIVYEDDDILIINKQAGLIVHPTYNFPTGTLANAITYYMKEKGEEYKLRFVNRLDMNTSGLIIVAKNSHAQDSISRQMQNNETVKEYKAIVHGIMEKEKDTINLPIDKDPNHKARRCVTKDGYPSVTHYEVLQKYEDKSFGSINGFSLLKLKLDTGRTHQIRVHLSYLGHPIVGDELYGQLFGYENVPEWMPRQALHAFHLELNHPVTGERMTFEAKMPKDMEDCLEYIEKL